MLCDSNGSWISLTLSTVLELKNFLCSLTNIPQLLVVVETQLARPCDLITGTWLHIPNWWHTKSLVMTSVASTRGVDESWVLPLTLCNIYNRGCSWGERQAPGRSSWHRNMSFTVRSKWSIHSGLMINGGVCHESCWTPLCSTVRLLIWPPSPVVCWLGALLLLTGQSERCIQPFAFAALHTPDAYRLPLHTHTHTHSELLICQRYEHK